MGVENETTNASSSQSSGQPMQERRPVGPREFDLVTTEPTVVVVHCADPRFQAAFEQFLVQGLRIRKGEYVPFVIPGGIAPLSDPMSFPKEAKIVRDKISYILNRFTSIRRVILFNHEDCRYYQEVQRILGSLFLQRAMDIVQRQHIDLGKAMKAILGLRSGQLDIELYYARFSDPSHTKAVFDRIELA